MRFGYLLGIAESIKRKIDAANFRLLNNNLPDKQYFLILNEVIAEYESLWRFKEIISRRKWE